MRGASAMEVAYEACCRGTRCGDASRGVCARCVAAGRVANSPVSRPRAVGSVSFIRCIVGPPYRCLVLCAYLEVRYCKYLFSYMLVCDRLRQKRRGWVGQISAESAARQAGGCAANVTRLRRQAPRQALLDRFVNVYRNAGGREGEGLPEGAGGRRERGVSCVEKALS